MSHLPAATPDTLPTWFTAAWQDHITERIEAYASKHAEKDDDGDWQPQLPDAIVVGEWITYPSAKSGFIYPYEGDTEDSIALEAADWVLLNAWIKDALDLDTQELTREINQGMADAKDERGYGPL